MDFYYLVLCLEYCFYSFRTGGVQSFKIDFFAACLKSAIKSLISSKPTEQRINPSVMPNLALSSFGNFECVVVFGFVIIVRESPKLDEFDAEMKFILYKD